MSEKKRTLKVPRALLIQETKLLVAAAATYPAVNARLPEDYMDDTDNLRATLEGLWNTQNAAEGMQEQLTAEQDAALKILRPLIGAAQRTAKIAFRGQTARLREQFGIGDQLGRGLGATVARGLIIAGSLADAEIAAAMAAKGWLAADTVKLTAAANTVSGKDTTQETQKGVKKGSTATMQGTDVDLFDRDTTIQNAANLEWPKGPAANIAARAAFRLGIFPPVHNSGVPTIPRKLRAKALDAGSAKIFVDYNKATRASDYLLTARNKATAAVLLTLVTEDNKATLTFTGVTAGTEVEITVEARNELGSSKPAGPVSAKVP